jgi:hypothetical protein
MRGRKDAMRRELTAWLPTQGYQVATTDGWLMELLLEWGLHLQGDVEPIPDIVGIMHGKRERA